jgi:ankyrin repeat protein
MRGLSGNYKRRTFLLALVVLTGGLAWLTVATFRREKATAALIPAIRIGDAAAVRRLLQAGADPNVEDKPHKAFSFLDILKGLLHPAPLAAKRQYPTALLLALQRNDLPVLRLLVEDGADVNVHDSNGSTPLLLVANQFASTEDESAPFADKVSLTGKARATQTAIARLLLEHGVNVNDRDSEGFTPLLRAAQSGAANVAELLLNRGADINARDSYGDTVLGAAVGALDVESNHTEIVTFLLDRGANINALSGSETVLQIAAQDDNEALFRLLLARGANVNEQDDFGRTVLIDVAQSGSPTLLRLLLAHGAQVNARDENGWTALMCAAFGDQPDNVRLLLESGADFRLKNQAGATAQQLAATSSEQIVRLLRQAEAARR